MLPQKNVFPNFSSLFPKNKANFNLGHRLILFVLMFLIRIIHSTEELANTQMVDVVCNIVIFATSFLFSSKRSYKMFSLGYLKMTLLDFHAYKSDAIENRIVDYLLR